MTRKPAASFRRGYVSYRRLLLDDELRRIAPQLHGLVLDAGGKRASPRGTFRPPEHVKQWIYANIDAGSAPDVVADVARLPLRDASVDAVVCCEVLEHVEDLKASVAEAHRVLKPGGLLVASTPFLYPRHGDPSDFRRPGVDLITRLLRDFESAEIRPMGGSLGSIGMMMELAASRRLRVGPARKMAKALGRSLCWLDTGRSPDPEFTTGYFWVAMR